MRRYRLLHLAQAAVLLAAAGLSVTLPPAAFSWLDALGFVIGLTILKLSDVWLPRGDAVGMSSALALGALLVFDVRVVLGMLLLAELLALVPRGRDRVWKAALGAVTAEAAAAAACSYLLVILGLHPAGPFLLQSEHAFRAQQYVSLLGVGLLFATLEFGLLQVQIAFAARQPMRAALLGSMSFGGWLIAAQASAGILAALMHRTIGIWGLAVSVVMVLVMRQSFVLLLEIRQAYNSTIAVLVKAMEAQTPGREGVAERNAELCTGIGRSLGLHGRELERLRYAAMLHGIVDTEPDAQAAIAEDEGERIGPSRVISEVEFLSDVVPIMQLCDLPASVRSAHRNDLVCAYVIMAVGTRTGSVSPESREALESRVSPRIIRDVNQAVAQLVIEDGLVNLPLAAEPDAV